MNFSRTFPKALLVLLLVFSFLFVGAMPAQAVFHDQILGGLTGLGKSLLGGLLGPAGFVLDLLGIHIGGFNPFSFLGGAIGGIAATIIKGVAALVVSVIFIITMAAFEVGGGLIDAALGFNSQVGAIAKSGYNVTLGVANMGFLVALVVIAFSTMFRQEAFGYKKALPRLIIAALFINFGFFIVTNWFIAPVDAITKSLSDAAHFDPANLKDLFNVKSIFSSFLDLHAFQDLSGALGDIVKALAGVILAAIFSFIGIIAVFALAIMLFIRGIALSILVILLPIAWVMWVFPNLKLPGGGNPWSMWWEAFTRWLLFAPFAMFFFFLAITLANKGGLTPLSSDPLYSSLGAMIVTSGLIMGGLFVSNKMGITGAGMALGAVAAGRTWVTAKGKKYGRKAAYETSKRALPREKMQNLERLGINKGFFGKHLAAPIRAAARGAAIQTTAATKAREAEFIEKIKDLAPYQISDMYGGLSEENRAYALRHMIDKGYDWELVPEAREDIVKWAKKDASGTSAFDKDQWGLKKAELDLVDAGISPDALAKMEEARPRLAQALKGGNKEEVERIKYVLGLEVEEILRKDMNVITPNGMGKLQRRIHSDAPPDEKRPGKFKVGYAMFGDDEVGAVSQGIYGAGQRRYLSMDRAESLRRAKGNLRSDGNRNMSGAGIEGLKTFNKWFLEPLSTASGQSPKQIRDLPPAGQTQLLREHWDTVKPLAEERIRASVAAKQRELGLSADDAKRAEELELKKLERAVPEKLIQDIQQLVDSSRGAAHATLAI